MCMFIIFSKSYINTQEENFSYETEAWLDPLKAKRLFFLIIISAWKKYFNNFKVAGLKNGSYAFRHVIAAWG